MKERPIIFSAPMVRALLAGAKTQTRRVMQSNSRLHPEFVLVDYGNGWTPFASDDGESNVCDDGNEFPIPCPYGVPGDRLWVRETWRVTGVSDLPVREMSRFYRNSVQYRADRDESYIDRYRNPLFMPHWASRLTLEVTGVRVERLQDISTADCWAEGIPASPDVNPIHEYEELWDSINAKRAPWASNPWVWVLQFRRVGK